jgi:glycosyltransferase involved in cell wall biosynthesis
MDILFYTSSLGGGGAEKHVQRIANAVQEMGHQVTVAVARSGGSYEQNLSDGVDRIVLSEGWLKSSTWRLMRSVRPLRKYISEHRPDVVCSVMDHVNVRLLRALSGLEDPPSAVISVQNNPERRFGEKAGWRNRLLHWRMQQSYDEADQIVALSQGIAQQLVEMGLADSDRLTVIHNAGLDDEIYETKEFPINERAVPGEPLLVACGSLTEQKGYPYLLDAFHRVRNEREAKLWILGEGERRDQVESKIGALGLEEEVELLGFRDNPFKFMAAADVFVLSSLWEGFGNVVVEAMACGTPVVATDCPHGPGEIITHRESGLLVPPANAETLAEALLRVLDDQALQERLVESGHERARDFHVAEIGRQYLELFREVVSEKSAPRPAPR